MECHQGKMKGFIDDVYRCYFTDILHKHETSDNSDIETNLESIDVVEYADNEKEVEKN